jgi:hypothetical protein
MTLVIGSLSHCRLRLQTKILILLNFICPDVLRIKTKYNCFLSNTSITFLKYSLGYMFQPQLGHHQALYTYRSFILQYILGSQTIL